MHVYIFMPDIIRGQDLVSGNGDQYPLTGAGIRERGSVSLDRRWYPGTGVIIRGQDLVSGNGVNIRGQVLVSGNGGRSPGLPDK